MHQRSHMSNNTFSTISSEDLHTITGGKAATRQPTKPAATKAAPDPGANAIKGCLTGAAGGIVGGPHGALIGCAVGVGKSILDGLGTQFGLPSSTGSKP